MNTMNHTPVLRNDGLHQLLKDRTVHHELDVGLSIIHSVTHFASAEPHLLRPIVTQL